MEADRLRSRRLPEDVVLEDPYPAVAAELRREAAGALGENLCCDDVVGLPRVAELARAVLRVSARDPVHLVRPDPGLVLPVEEAQVALAQLLERALRDKPFFRDEEAVSPERFDLIGRKRVDQDRGRAFSGS